MPKGHESRRISENLQRDVSKYASDVSGGVSFMEMAIIMSIIFLFTDAMMVGVCMFAYGGKEEYSEGMIFGVHIPKGNVEEEVVQVIAQKYKRQFKKFQHWNMLLGILVCGLAFVSMGIFMIAWTVWLIEYIGGIYWFVYGTHQNVSIESGKGMDCGGDEADNLY